MRVIFLEGTEDPEVFIARCARTSRGRPPWEGDVPTREEAQAFLRRLLRAGHFSVLEFAHMTLGFAGFSRACLDQMRTHRHLSFLAESTRHVDMEGRPLVLPEGLREGLGAYEEAVWAAYRHLRDVADLEVARCVLPLGLSYRWVASGNLRAWREFCEKRLAPEAHPEIRYLAAQVVRIGSSVAPVVFEELVDDAEVALGSGWPGPAGG